jgi:hypothetical protein
MVTKFSDFKRTGIFPLAEFISYSIVTAPMELVKPTLHNVKGGNIRENTATRLFISTNILIILLSSVYD